MTLHTSDIDRSEGTRAAQDYLAAKRFPVDRSRQSAPRWFLPSIFLSAFIGALAMLSLLVWVLS